MEAIRISSNGCRGGFAVKLDFAPMVDVAAMRWGRVMEGAGEDAFRK
jgi:beta-glucosidase-like glycosyl hydrolase